MTDAKPEPRYPLPAVGGIVFNEDGNVLLIQRGKQPRKGEWSVPGGKVDWGETLEAALIREVKEETGIDIEILGLLDALDLIAPVDTDTGGASDKHYVLIDYLARAIGGDLQAGDDAAAAEFVPVAEAVDRVDWDETARIIEDGAEILAGIEEMDDVGA